MSGPDQTRDLSRLERFASIIREDNVDVDSLDSAQLAQYLKDNKVDMAGPQKRFDAVLKQAQARRRLEIARQRRLGCAAKAQQLLSGGAATVEAVRARVKKMIENIGQRDPEGALVFAREFEKATPEDMQSLEQDLMLLEQLEDGEGDKQNPS